MTMLIMPAAGEGTRFRQAGYTVPKPFIQVGGSQFLELALRPFDGIPGLRKLVILRDDHVERYIRGGESYDVLPLHQPQEGAALSVLAALCRADDDEDVIVANSDQVFDQSLRAWHHHCVVSGCDGSILTFKRHDDPKWSYARVAPYDDTLVTEVREKQPISPHATCGVYYFRQWRTLRTAICKMIAAGERYNGEFYLAPVYQQLINAGLTVRRYAADTLGFHSIGTPELLREYVDGIRS